MTYKLKLYTEDEEGEEGFLDFFMEVNKKTIRGFYIPILDGNGLPCINMLANGQWITILLEDHIKDWLWDNLASGAIENK